MIVIVIKIHRIPGGRTISFHTCKLCDQTKPTIQILDLCLLLQLESIINSCSSAEHTYFFLHDTILLVLHPKQCSLTSHGQKKDVKITYVTLLDRAPPTTCLYLSYIEMNLLIYSIKLRLSIIQ